MKGGCEETVGGPMGVGNGSVGWMSMEMEVDGGLVVSGSQGSGGAGHRALSDTRPTAALKLDELFSCWLSRGDTRRMVERMMEEAEAGRDVKVFSATSPSGSGHGMAGGLSQALTSGNAGTSGNRAEGGSLQIVLSPTKSLGSSSALSSPKSPISKFLSNNLTFSSPGSPLMRGKPGMNETAHWHSSLSLEPSIAEAKLDSPPSTPPTVSNVQSSVRRKSSLQSVDSTISAAKRKPFAKIPQFYFPEGEVDTDQEEQERGLIRVFFSNLSSSQRDSGGGTSKIALGPSRGAPKSITDLVVNVIGLPSFYGRVIFDRIMGASSDVTLTENRFMDYYERECAGKSRPARLFNSLRNGADRSYLVPSDFTPLIENLLHWHPGLAFLRATPEFQQRYAETVVERIFYRCRRRTDSRLTLLNITQEKLLDTLMQVDEEENINRERKYFSYEHFYVLYCRFWELDSDHDLLINREDLLRYGGHSLTYRIVDRIFEGRGRKLDCREEGSMSYTDFVWFCLSEEDKTTDTAIDYWFRCVDRDGDGVITMYDLEHFYSEQLHRMESLSHEPVQLIDILCQLLDMISPNIQPPHIRRRHLKSCRLASNFFNILFNLHKFFSLEGRDPLQIRQEHATPELNDWDRFAALEYVRLIAEGDGEEEMEEGWEEVDDSRMLELS